MLLSTPFTDGTLVASPALFQDDFGDPNLGTVWVVALTALCACDQPTLKVVAQRAAHDTHVLLQHEVIRH